MNRSKWDRRWDVTPEDDASMRAYKALMILKRNSETIERILSGDKFDEDEMMDEAPRMIRTTRLQQITPDQTPKEIADMLTNDQQAGLLIYLEERLGKSNKRPVWGDEGDEPPSLESYPSFFDSTTPRKARPSKMPTTYTPPGEWELSECNVCGKKSKYQCKKCKNKKYCGPQCQKKDWVEHQAECKMKN